MASTSRRLCQCLRQISQVTPSKRKCIPPPSFPCRPRVRYLSSSASWRADRPTTRISQARTKRAEKDLDDEDVPELPTVDPSEYRIPSKPATVADLPPEERANFETLSKDEQTQYLGLRNHYQAILEEGAEEELESEAVQAQVNKLDRELERDYPLEFDNTRVRDSELGFWAEDEDDELGITPDNDDDWDESMITSIAESELEVHREVREYTRAAIWDMPLLQKFAKPFAPPDHATPLRFRYTTYMGEEHPAQKKVVVEFCSKDLQRSLSPKLTEAQRTKLIKLVGVRYNPDTDVVRMSSERFEHAAQNKRYLGDLVNSLVKEARDAQDMFEDIPLDFRHHKLKTQHAFPEEWKMTQQRVEQLNGVREAARALPPPTLKELQKQKEKEGAQRVMEYAAAMPLGRREPPGRTPFQRAV